MPVINYETLNTNTDLTTTRTLLHESIPLTGAIISGTYGTEGSEENIKNYTHGMFQSVYDYPYLSSSANHIFDITMGYHASSPFSGSSSTQNAKKINLYNEFAQVLLGYTASTNTVEIFESDLNFGDNNSQMKSCYFLSFARLLTKDQVKKGTFAITLNTGSWVVDNVGQPTWPAGPNTIYTDASASEIAGTNNKGNAGEYGVLYRNNGDGTYGDGSAVGVGVVFYQAGIVVLSSSIFDGRTTGGTTYPLNTFYRKHSNGFLQGVSGAFTGSTISASCDALRHRIANISYNNTTELNSTIYFCRAPANKFNYSYNPTYTTGSKMVVKTIASDTPVAYITTIGLYNSSNELMAIAKLSEPLKKDPTNELTLRVRLDY
jgi:Zn/Cd-binding protein ZinT